MRMRRPAAVGILQREILERPGADQQQLLRLRAADLRHERGEIQDRADEHALRAFAGAQGDACRSSSW